jgi:hypothetical protein
MSSTQHPILLASPQITSGLPIQMLTFESNHPLVGKRIVNVNPSNSDVLKQDIIDTLHPCIIIKNDDFIEQNIKGKWLIVTDNNQIILRIRKF